MAGLYADIPSHRIPYDMDGTAGILFTSGWVPSDISNATLRNMNNESDDAVYNWDNAQAWHVAWIFPRKLDLSGIFFAFASGYYWGSWVYSTDTTNGVDGTWNAITGWTYSTSVNPQYRSAIHSLSLAGVKGLRFDWSSGSYPTHTFKALHLYGTISAGENDQRLEFWHPTLNQKLGVGAVDSANKGFDWGDAARASSADATFRVKNMSASKTANTVTLSMDALTDASPSFVGEHLLSSDGVSFAATASAGTLAAGAISSILTIRRTLPANAALTLWALRLKAAASSWT